MSSEGDCFLWLQFDVVCCFEGQEHPPTDLNNAWVLGKPELFRSGLLMPIGPEPIPADAILFISRKAYW